MRNIFQKIVGEIINDRMGVLSSNPAIVSAALGSGSSAGSSVTSKFLYVYGFANISRALTSFSLYLINNSSILDKFFSLAIMENNQSALKRLKYLMLVVFDIMPTAFILVNCTLGSEEKIINEIAKLSDVKEVRGTYGVHDIFVKVKSDNTETMNHTITNKIRKVPGITSTVTLVVIEEQGGKGDT